MKVKTSRLFETSSSINHGFFGRSGGGSNGIYTSLNCGTYSHDDPANIVSNRNIAVCSLSDKATLIEIHQTHSNKVHIVDDDFTIMDADAVVTKHKNIALSIVTADCAPVLLADPTANIIAAAHAGWQGAKNGIIENTIKAMCSLGATRENIIAAVGPCIGQQSYEVGPEFYQQFTDKSFFKNSDKANHHLFDLEGFVLHQLKQSNILQIEPLNIDTYDENNDFFSYRRKTHLGENDYGRQISIILQK
ncbi:MAG: peptidoglycan editing factor PgeF [Kordiimonadaceae bacterium]|nr:peptidoglycan editing factor PgeF [Kordiimonadaceae bacterium]MBT6032955.1 peptidoglycan editing factor PgeF [Kordiimonadaceae bacterium]